MLTAFGPSLHPPVHQPLPNGLKILYAGLVREDADFHPDFLEYTVLIL
jgi:hypothetical protein